MLYPVEKLLANRGNLLCVQQKETVRNALAKMVQNDFSQLPVVDDAGNLSGIISSEVIARTYFQVNDQIPLSNLPVHDCQERPQTLRPDADLFEALDLLQKVYAIVIVEGRKPIGILTAYDTTHFFRNITEGLLLVEDIETTLRQYIEAILCEDNQMQAALTRAFKSDKQDSSRPAYSYDKLNFHQHVQLITTEGNWSRFEAFFEPKRLFTHYMNEVNQIRNQLAHFRDDIDVIQFDALRRSRRWLENRPKPSLSLMIQDAVHLQEIVNAQVISPQGIQTQQAVGSPLVANGPDQSKYEPLANWLKSQNTANAIRVKFDEIEALLHETLPPSAREHRSWWANDATRHSQSRAWLTAGWRVDDVDLAVGNVTFRYTHNALHQVFFADVAQRLREIRPGIGTIKTSTELNYCNFGAGRSGFTFGWSFPRNQSLRIELYIDTYDSEKNQKAFAQLEAQKAAIESRVGAPLEWIPLLGKRASRIYIARPIDITASPEDLTQAKSWAVDNMINFMDALQPRLKELALDQPEGMTGAE